MSIFKTLKSASMASGRLAMAPNKTTVLAGFLLLIFFIFPQIPIQIRFIVPIVALLCCMQLELLREKIVWWLLGFTIYVSIVGIMVSQFTGEGSVSDALYGIKAMALSLVALIFARRANLLYFVILLSVILVGCATGMVLNSKFTSIYSRIPFPIFSERDLFIRGASELTSERFGGFTYEAGVAGGMSAFFLLFLFAIAILLFSNHKLRAETLGVAPIGAAAAIAFALTIYLSKTKSSLFVFVGALLVYSIYSLFAGRKAGAVWIKGAVIVSFVVGLFSLPVALNALKNTSMGEYINREVDNFYLLVSRGFDRTEGLGLNTRIECAKKAIYALPYRPTGGGHSGGLYYVGPILEKINSTPEMDFFHNQGVFDGYKSALFNIIGQGGVVSLILLGYVWTGIYRQLTRTGLDGAGGAAVILIAGLILLGLTVELLPYLEMTFLAYGFSSMPYLARIGMAAQPIREHNSKKPLRQPHIESVA